MNSNLTDNSCLSITSSVINSKGDISLKFKPIPSAETQFLDMHDSNARRYHDNLLNSNTSVATTSTASHDDNEYDHIYISKKRQLSTTIDYNSPACENSVFRKQFILDTSGEINSATPGIAQNAAVPYSEDLFTKIQVMELAKFRSCLSQASESTLRLLSPKERPPLKEKSLNLKDSVDDFSSVATSLLVEVASVDDDGSYLRYGEASDDDAETNIVSFRQQYGSSSPALSSTGVAFQSNHDLFFGPEDTAQGFSSSSSVSSTSYRDEFATVLSSGLGYDELSSFGYEAGSELCRRDGDESDFDLNTVIGNEFQNEEESFAVYPYSSSSALSGCSSRTPQRIGFHSENGYDPRNNNAQKFVNNSIASMKGQTSSLSLDSQDHNSRLRHYHKHLYYQSRKREKRRLMQL